MLPRTFFLAGRALFTVSNPEGTRYTFKITRRDARDGGDPVYFAALLTGPNNVGDYSYIGVVDPADGAVLLTSKSRYTDDAMPVRVLRWLLRQAWLGRALPPGYHVHHEGRCGRCGRTLTVPESIETGLGPECAQLVDLAV